MSDDEALKKARLELHAKARNFAISFLLEKGLYSEIDAEGSVSELAEQKIRDANIGTFDCYCTGCGRETSFIASAIPVKHAGGGLRAGDALSQPPSVFALRAVCQRDLTTYLYVFEKVRGRVIKIGQFPSMADISFGELKGLDASLDPLDRQELGKALGLFSHDVASGAFVYLRRVFERMIARAHDRHAQAKRPLEGFEKMRIDQKIAALKDQLPERVVRNSAVFSVLSAGIHELSEQECLDLFPVLKAVIFQMLEQEEHKRKKEITERETDAAFQALLSRAAASDESAKEEK